MGARGKGRKGVKHSMHGPEGFDGELC